MTPAIRTGPQRRRAVFELARARDAR